jgi:hypothetical protein
VSRPGKKTHDWRGRREETRAGHAHFFWLSRVELPVLALLRSFINLKIHANALKCSLFFSLLLFYSLFFAIVVSRSCVYIYLQEGGGRKDRIART